MDVNEALQLIGVGVIVLSCAWRAFKAYAPVASWRLQARLSHALEQGTTSSWIRELGRRLRPALPALAAGCGSGCARCGGCATAPGPVRSIPLHLMPDA